MKTVRPYKKLLNEIINLTLPFKIDILDYVIYEKDIYPMISLTHISKTAKKNIVIFSGQHGEEYYSVHILLKWLQQCKIEDYSEFNFYIYPICNPWGYSHNSRKNGARQETTNASKFIKNSDIQELSILFDYVPTSVDLCVDVHGDVDKHNAYMYERKLEHLASIAQTTMIENDYILPYERTRTIYTCKVMNGTINTPREDEGLEAVMEKAGAEYTLTIELPGKCNWQKRTAGGIAILNSIFRLYKEQNQVKKEEVKPNEEIQKVQTL